MSGMAGGLFWVLLCWMNVAVAEEPAGEPSAGAEPAAEVTRLATSTGLGDRDLARRFPERAVWLEVEGSDSELALLEPERQAVARGAVLLMGDQGQPVASGLPGAMPSRLAEHGWATLVVGLPQPSLVDESAAGGAAADGAADPASVMIDVMSEPAAATHHVAHRERVRSILAAGEAELSRRGYQRIVFVGVGLAALPVMEAAMGNTGEPGELVWIAPRFPAAEAEAWPASLDGLEDWLILDLANPLVTSPGYRDRAAVFLRHGLSGYRQQRLVMSEPVSVRDAPAVVNRLLGWLALTGDGTDAP
ncbi:DUF3530 family protein [Marinobacter zhejiangensis]|uniref:DUF3530 domain-containing protein n=1 Tax=Marinobacter zhejiangensis TaxID=488535 RepID=A0A1I4L246_9GAMM|nr:DUF3530 family protein [Marinobacter zhejiangensis]SFL84956.1 Protein of unknown function [Marinobacter zhejiangensis]